MLHNKAEWLSIWLTLLLTLHFLPFTPSLFLTAAFGIFLLPLIAKKSHKLKQMVLRKVLLVRFLKLKQFIFHFAEKSRHNPNAGGRSGAGKFDDDALFGSSSQRGDFGSYCPYMYWGEWCYLHSWTRLGKMGCTSRYVFFLSLDRGFEKGAIVHLQDFRDSFFLPGLLLVKRIFFTWQNSLKALMYLKRFFLFKIFGLASNFLCYWFFLDLSIGPT